MIFNFPMNFNLNYNSTQPMWNVKLSPKRILYRWKKTAYRLPFSSKQYYQRERRRRALLQHQNFDFLFYLGVVWLLYTKQAQYNEGCAKFQKCNNQVGVDLNLFKVLWHTWDPVGSPPGQQLNFYKHFAPTSNLQPTLLCGE